MRPIIRFALIATLAGAPMLAQAATATDSSATAQTKPAPHSTGKPVDHGPYTPQANQAYQGGGVVLQGAPGAPAPTPEATPPGQTPRNMVPAR